MNFRKNPFELSYWRTVGRGEIRNQIEPELPLLMLWTASSNGTAMCYIAEAPACKLKVHQVFLLGRNWLSASVWASVLVGLKSI
jgi:hypothetical protein